MGGEGRDTQSWGQTLVLQLTVWLSDLRQVMGWPSPPLLTQDTVVLPFPDAALVTHLAQLQTHA